MNATLGMLIFALGGLAGATFLLPARGMKGWAYETWWLEKLDRIKVKYGLVE